MKNILLIIFAILLFTGSYLLAQNPYIQHYTTVDGLPSNMVYQVYQDSRKFLWFATDAGVAKFDGSKFTYYRKNEGLSTNEVVKIKEDSFGRIWFFNLDATLNFYYQNTIYNATNAPFLDSLKSNEFFHDFYEDKDKTIYFYYNHQRDIFALDSQNKVRKYKIPSLLVNSGTNQKPHEGMVIRYMSRAATGEFYLWTRPGLFKLKSLTEKPTLISDKYGIKSVFPVSKQRKYLVICGKNMPYWEIRKSYDEILIDTITPPIRMTSDFISSIVEDVNGFLWISTFDQGISCYKDNKLIRHFDIKEGQAIIQDHEKNIWISSMKDGVYKISPYINLHPQYESSSFGNSGIAALCSHISNGIWCTNGKTVFFLRDNELYTSGFQKEEGSFNQLVHLKNNTLLVGEVGAQQYVLEGIRPEPFIKKVHFNGVSVFPQYVKKFALNITGDGISSFVVQSLLFINPDKLFDNMRIVDIGERIFCTFYNTNNELCVNASRNYLYKNDSLMVCEELSSFDNKIITDHLILDNTTELFNIEGDSLFLLNNKQLFNLTLAFGYPIDLQIKYMDYHDSKLFMATTRNIYLCENPLNILEHKSVQLLPVDISFRNIHDILFNDGLLYIASDDGITAIPYAAIHEISTNCPIPYFQSIQINDKKDEANSQDIILTGSNRIQIIFSSINYSYSPVIFSYQLEGADNEWTTGTGTNVVYQNLPRGDYHFKLKVRKPTSGWSEPIEYGIKIRATFWQHPLFIVILSFILASLGFLFVIRRKNIQIKRREVEHQLVMLEQKALQAMMNPHFIFNALGSIQNYLLQSKPEEAGLYLSQFARLIRQNLNAINSSSINLEEEIDRLKNYLDLEKLRIENKFDYFIEVAENVEADEVRIPSMIIQPFVENAIWHGIALLDDKGKIVIRFLKHDGNALTVIIEDNGIGVTRSESFTEKREKHLHLGMEMTRKRLEILGRKLSVKTCLTFSELYPGAPNPGTRVELVVPVSYSME